MNTAAISPPIRERLRRLSARERLFLLVGGVVAALILIFLLFPESEAPPVELGRAAPLAPSSVASAAPPPVAVQQAPVAPSVNLEGMVLNGVMGGGPSGGAALILFPNGRQRLIRTGREVVPGVKVREIGVAHAILTGAAGDVRLELGRPGATALPGAQPSGDSRAGGASTADHRRQTMQYRLGLEPRKANGRIGGFALKPGATLPALQKAGLQPGDILVAVNGQPFESEEKVLELSQEIAGSYDAEFEFIRNGKRMKAVLPVNQRR